MTQKFEVGGTYENMKGPYEVIAIHDDAMVIRWQDGQEIETSVELQRNIIERMAYEKAEAARRQTVKTKESPSRKKKTPQKPPSP